MPTSTTLAMFLKLNFEDAMACPSFPGLSYENFFHTFFN